MADKGGWKVSRDFNNHSTGDFSVNATGWPSISVLRSLHLLSFYPLKSIL